MDIRTQPRKGRTLLTYLIVVHVGILCFEKWMMVLTIQDEGIRWSSYFRFLGGLDLGITSSWDILVVSRVIVRRHDL